MKKKERENGGEGSNEEDQVDEGEESGDWEEQGQVHLSYGRDLHFTYCFPS